jgi:MFS family permease
VITTYRRVLGLPGALAFSMSGLVARLSISMIGLGLVVLISSERGSYSLAGAVSATYVVATAVAAIFVARLMDQLGQGRVLLVGMTLSMTSLALDIVAIESGWPTAVILLFAAVSGGSLPMIGSAVRTRWAMLVEDKAMLQTAYAFEAVLDEVVFVTGPPLVIVLATAVHPLAGLTTAIVATTLGSLFLCSRKDTEPPASGRIPRGHGQEPMGWALLGPLAASAVCMGILFGGCEVATVAFADEQGHKAVSGLLLSLWALGSMLAGLLVGMVRWKATSTRRFRWALLVLAVLVSPLPFIGTFQLLGACLFLAGFAISPTLIAAVSLVEETVPVTRLTEGMAVFTTGLLAGVAPGAAVVGRVVDHAGASASYWVVTCAAFLGAAIGFASSAVRRDVVSETPARS